MKIFYTQETTDDKKENWGRLPDLAHHHAVEHILQLWGHDDYSLDGLPDVLETVSDYPGQPVEADQFLVQNRVHGLLVSHRELVLQSPKRTVLIGWHVAS